MILDLTQGLTAVAEIAIIVNKRKDFDFRRSQTIILLPGAHYRSDHCNSQHGNRDFKIEIESYV